MLIKLQKMDKFFVGKDYLLGSHFKLSVTPFFSNTMSCSFLFVPNVECCDTWHDRLGH